jgi:hypothetical protein
MHSAKPQVVDSAAGLASVFSTRWHGLEKSLCRPGAPVGNYVEKDVAKPV